MENIPESNEDRSNFPCWKGVLDVNGNVTRPIVYCACGEPIGLNHSISPDGVVNPSVWHEKKPNNNGCDWHVHITLLGWKEKYNGISFNQQSHVN